MENFVRNSKLNIEKEIKRIEQQPIALLERIKQIIDVIQTSLTLLKRAVAEY
ncbi:transcriptional regulator, partial [Klebsiella oxytoca]